MVFCAFFQRIALLFRLKRTCWGWLVMKVQLRIDSARGVLYWKASGHFSLQELLGAVAEVMKHPDYRPGLKSLNDLREVTVSFTTAEVRTVAEFLKGQDGLIGQGKIAMVLSNDAAYGMTRAFQVYATNPSMQFEVFRDIPSACEWLGIDPPEDLPD